jgi:HK97 family phage major capsid protein
MNEFLSAVMKAETKHVVDPRLNPSDVKTAAAGYAEDSDPAGGYLVQHPLWNQQIFNQYIQTAVIAPKCKQFIAGDFADGLKFKQVNETTRAGGTWFGGIRWYNFAEGVDITPADAVFTQLDVAVKQLGAAYYITEALIRDCPNLSEYVAGLVGKSLGQVMDREVLYGTLSAFTASMGHLSTVSLPPAGTYPTAAELATMYNSMAAGYLDGAEWYMSHKQFANLMNLTAPAASGGAGYAFPIMTIDAASDVKYRLFGHPVNVLEVGAASNAAGSIVFANWSEYGLVTKQAGLTPQVAMSLHVKFLSMQQCYRFYVRAGGAPLLASKVALTDSTTVSSVVST